MWIRDRVERLTAFVVRSQGLARFVHHDLSPQNVLVDGDRLSALIDWGEATWCDPAFDLAHLPPRVLPMVVAAYREVTPFDLDDTVEQRAVWDQLNVAAWRNIGGPADEWRRSVAGRAFELAAAVAEWPDRWRAIVA